MSDMKIKVILEEANVNKDFFTSNRKENNLKCPFCQQELEEDYLDVKLFGCENQNCKYSTHYDTVGTKNLWQELIRTRKALDVAVDAIDEILYLDSGKFCKEPAEMWKIAKSAKDKITALEQKDVK